MKHLSKALARAEEHVRAAAIADYLEWRTKTDPRGHDLLAALERHHLDVLEQMFVAARETTHFFVDAKRPRPRLRVVGE